MEYNEILKNVASHCRVDGIEELNPGDIVEILNLSSGQLYDIRSQNCNFERDWAKEIIGMRYRVKEVCEEGSSLQGLVRLDGWNKGGHFGGLFHKSQLMLYKKKQAV